MRDRPSRIPIAEKRSAMIAFSGPLPTSEHSGCGRSRSQRNSSYATQQVPAKAGGRAGDVSLRRRRTPPAGSNFHRRCEAGDTINWRVIQVCDRLHSCDFSGLVSLRRSVCTTKGGKLLLLILVSLTLSADDDDDDNGGFNCASNNRESSFS